MAVKIFLGLSVAIWMPYGLFCFFQPGFLSETAGLMLGSTTAETEVRAMYGGLQAAIGALALAGLVRANLTKGVLLTLAFLTGGLVVARMAGAAVAADDSSYTLGAIAFEFTSSICATVLYRLAPEATTGARSGNE